MENMCFSKAKHVEAELLDFFKMQIAYMILLTPYASDGLTEFLDILR